MALSYSFSNLCGALYEGGNITFTPDGSSLAAPCGNRVTIFDLRLNKTITLPFEARQNIQHLVFAPNAPLLLTIDEAGRCLVINFTKSAILNRINFKGIVSDAKFSPCGQYFAVAIDRKLKIWDAPTAMNGWQFTLRRELRQHLDRIVNIDWSQNSNFILTASRDLTVKLFSRDPVENFSPITFVDHRYPLRAAYFTSDMKRIISVSRDGVIISWVWWPPIEVDDYEKEGDILENRGFDLSHRDRSKALKKEGKETMDLETRKRKKMKMSSEDEINGADGTLAERSMFEESTVSDKLPIYSDGKWKLEKKVFCNDQHHGRVMKCCYHVHNGLLVIGYSNGILSLYECPLFDCLYTLSIGNESINSVIINNDGEWLGMASSQLGQLVVWEWRSETYLLKQQGHRGGIRCVATAPVLDSASANRGLDSRNNALGLGHKNLIVATGGEDGKVKLWDAESGFNFMTFIEHTATINDITFTPQGNAIISASSDGSVRAFDLTRYRNFRTFTSTLSNVQFMAIAVDGGGEILVAGCQGAEYSVLVWSIQTGKLLERLSGHENPVTSVQFHPHPSKPGLLVSGSWDGTLRIWDVFGRSTKGRTSEPLINTSGVLAVAFDPRANNQIAAATLSGNIWIWDSEEGRILGSIDGLRDIHSGRRIGDKFSANNTRAVKNRNKHHGSVGSGVNQNQHFSSIAYSSNGAWILAISKNSARVCFYDSDKRVLLRGFQLTHNFSLDGIRMELNSKHVNETGYAIQEFDLSDSEEDDEIIKQQRRIQRHLSLPGTQQGVFKSSQKAFQLHCWQVCFAQNGQQWCAATSHGLYVYSVDPKAGNTNGISTNHISQGHFDRFAPNLITRNVTPQNIIDALNSNEHSRAMILSLALNDFTLLYHTYISIPYKDIEVVVQSIPPLLVPSLLNFLRVCLSDVVKQPISNTSASTPAFIGGSPHLQYHLRWLTSLFSSSHLTALQQLDPVLVSGSHNCNSNNQTENLIAQCGILTSDLRTLCLLLLRNIQKVHVNLNLTFGANLRSLDFILSSK